MVGGRAGSVHARNDLGDKIRFGAMAFEVRQTRAAIRSESGDKAVELQFPKVSRLASLVWPCHRGNDESSERTAHVGMLGSWALARVAAARATRTWESCILDISRWKQRVIGVIKRYRQTAEGPWRLLC